jgi:hypothetical protein
METWKDIPGFEGKYQINLDGQVRSMDRLVIVKSKLGKERQVLIKGAVLKMRKHKDGYWYVILSRKTTGLHRIMYSTFIDSNIEGMDVDHKDGNKDNFSIDNLRVCKRVNNLTYKNVKRKNKYGFVGIKKGALTKKHGQRWFSVVWDFRVGKNILSHVFASPEEAHEDYCKRRFEIYGDNFKEQE